MIGPVAVPGAHSWCIGLALRFLCDKMVYAFLHYLRHGAVPVPDVLEVLITDHINASESPLADFISFLRTVVYESGDRCL